MKFYTDRESLGGDHPQLNNIRHPDLAGKRMT
jgi:hypothetical protein